MSLKLLINSSVGYYGALVKVPKDKVNEEQVKHDLTVRNGVYWNSVNSGVPTGKHKAYLELFSEDDNFLYVPRHYEVPVKNEDDLFSVDMCRPRYQVDGIRHSIELRNEVQKEASASLTKDDQDKIISLSCGAGKTVVSLHAAAEGERFPLLIVVHTNALMDQWRQRIKDFYGLDDSEIGHVQAGISDWEGKKIAVAMLHSLSMKNYPKSFYRYWRCIIFDECHRLGAELFSQACSLFYGERWGLSATVKRSDDMDQVFRLHLGGIVYQNLQQDLQPKAIFVRTGVTTQINKFISRGGKINMPRLTTWLSDHPVRNELILQTIDKLVEKNRTVLVLGERLVQLHELNQACKATSKAVHVGAMSQEERAEALTKQVVFATQHLAREGLDRPEFDTLLILIPFGGLGRLVQSVGRILRTKPGKKDPVVLIFVDDLSISIALGRKMERWFRSQKYECQYLTREMIETNFKK